MIEVIGHIENPADVGELRDAVCLLADAANVALRGPCAPRRYYTGPDYSAGRNWHHEASGVPSAGKLGCGESRVKVLFWAWPEASEFRECGTNVPIPVNAGDVVIADDYLVEHRMPAEVSEGRWFLRMFCKE